MPVAGIQQQALRRLLQVEVFCLFAIIVYNGTAAPQAHGCLYSLLMPVAAPFGVVHAIDIKDPFYRKGDDPLDYGQVAPAVGKCLQVQFLGHSNSVWNDGFACLYSASFSR